MAPPSSLASISIAKEHCRPPIYLSRAYYVSDCVTHIITAYTVWYVTTFHVTFLSVTHHVRTYVLSENRSLIQSLTLTRSAMNPHRLLNKVDANYRAYRIRSFVGVLTRHLMDPNKYTSWTLLLGLWAPDNTHSPSVLHNYDWAVLVPWTYFNGSWCS